MNNISKEQQSKNLTQLQYIIMKKRADVYNQIVNLQNEYDDLTSKLWENNQELEDIWKS